MNLYSGGTCFVDFTGVKEYLPQLQQRRPLPWLCRTLPVLLASDDWPSYVPACRDDL